ncbi:MAG: winged helix-turn-helix domain-containing protein [Lachnospiraceae bacterium]|nr:winged helix-turn-helix domain-containing protein [Lachnospiraceae bacterium]
MQKIMDVLRDVPVVEHPLEQSCILASSDLKIHLKEQTVYRNGERVTMTHHEFFTLAYLAQHPGWVFSKEQIYEAVWQETGDRCGTAVVNVISQIRRKLGEGYIKTVVGSGYKFER